PAGLGIAVGRAVPLYRSGVGLEVAGLRPRRRQPAGNQQDEQHGTTTHGTVLGFEGSRLGVKRRESVVIITAGRMSGKWKLIGVTLRPFGGAFLPSSSRDRGKSVTNRVCAEGSPVSIWMGRRSPRGVHGHATTGSAAVSASGARRPPGAGHQRRRTVA